jgi:hypothetical protein
MVRPRQLLSRHYRHTYSLTIQEHRCGLVSKWMAQALRKEVAPKERSLRTFPLLRRAILFSRFDLTVVEREYLPTKTRYQIANNNTGSSRGRVRH